MILRSSLIIFALSVFTSYGQKALTASQAVFTALENNYQIQIAEKQHAINQKKNSWGEAGLYPTVSLNVNQNNTVQDNTNNPFTFTPGVFLNQSFSPSLALDWNLFSGFRVRMSKQQLEQLEQQTASNAMAVIETTIQDVLKAYYTAQLQHDRMELFKNVMDLSRERHKYYELKEKYNTSTSLELLQFRNQYLTDSSNYLLQVISYENAMRNLVILMNTDDEENINYELTDKMDVLLAEVDYESSLQDMMESNQNLKNQYIALELQKTNTSLQRSFLYPTLNFSAGYQPNWGAFKRIDIDTMPAIHTNTITYYGNLSLRYTLFNNWKSKRAVEVSKIQEDIATLNIENMEKTLSSTLKNLIDLYHARLTLVNISQENMAYAEKAFELAQKRFNLGSINSVDLASFQNSYQNTMIQHYENLFNKMDTFLEIYKMTGKISLGYTNGE